MAYPRPAPYDPRPPPDSERDRSLWGLPPRQQQPLQHQQPPPPLQHPQQPPPHHQQQQQHHPPPPPHSHPHQHQHQHQHHLQPPPQPPTWASTGHPHPSASDLLDPESESSDVSDTPGEDIRAKQMAGFPTPLPPPPSKLELESSEAIQSRLRDLQRVEDMNEKKLETLRAKRARKDEAIRRRREAQDSKIRAVMDARSRRDDKIARRRRAEDDAFDRFDHDLEEEGNNLRRRLKRLKRGLPVDDILNPGASVSSASMSPPAPYAILPPPAKRHQSGPPNQNDSPLSNNHPLQQPPREGLPASGYISTPPQTSFPPPPLSGPPPHQPPPPLPPPSSQHQQPPGPPPPAHYQPSPPYAHGRLSGPPPPLPAQQQQGRPPPNLSDRNSYGSNGYPASPHVRPSAIPPAGTTPPIPPARHVSTTYDTRPPPPLPPPPAASAGSSGFATVNATPPSGFAAINHRNTSTPPLSNVVPVRDLGSGSIPRSVETDRGTGLGRPQANSTPTGSATKDHATGKRAPSTTHPYQMSEAFANRHHHCERTDDLNRGIWTYYGPGGTQEAPTEPPVEMYLRCNHDGCRRIDWRTVHGLQCHIVKNHDQPKGTIGSLEKALRNYGVPVTEIASFERVHGHGAGGTLADTKNIKVKQRQRDSSEKADDIKRWPDPHSSPANHTYRSNLAMTLGAPMVAMSTASRPPASEEAEETDHKPTVVAAGDVRPPSSQHAGGFAAVNGWQTGSVNTGATETPDTDMKDAPPTADSTPTRSQPRGDGSSVWAQAENTSSVVTTASVADPVKTTDEVTNSQNSLPPPQGPGTAIRTLGPPFSTASTSPRNANGQDDAEARGPTGDKASVAANHPADQVKQEAEQRQVEDRESDPPASRPSQNGEEAAATTQEDTHMGGTVDEIDHATAGEAPHPAPTEQIGPTQEPPTRDEEPHSAASEKSRAEIDDAKAVLSPESSKRRVSLGTRRNSGRRSSLAANKMAEKEREMQREREEAEREREAELERTKADEPEREDEDEEDSITVVVSGPTLRRKEKEEEPVRTPKRGGSGRHVKKSR